MQRKQATVTATLKELKDDGLRALMPFANNVATWAAETLPVALETMSAFIQTRVMPVFQALGAWWSENGPVIIATGQQVVDALVAGFEALRSGAEAVVRNWETIKPIIVVVAGLVATVMIPHWVALGVAAAVNAAKNVAAWVTTHVAAVKAALIHSAEVVKMVARWLFLGAQSLLHGAKVVAGWAMTGAAAIAQGAVHVAQVGIMVAKWAFMGVQSLLHAAKVAAAWLIAMGPIGLIVAAVIAAVALIVANWDTVKAAALAVKDWIVEKFGILVDFIRGLPGKISSAASGM